MGNSRFLLNISFLFTNVNQKYIPVMKGNINATQIKNPTGMVLFKKAIIT